MADGLHNAEAGVPGFLRDAFSNATGGVIAAVIVGAALVNWNDWRSIMPTTLAAAFAIASVRYWIVLGYGASPPRSAERARYNRLRSGLREGGEVGQRYEQMLRAALDWVDRRCGDKDQSGPEWAAWLVGLKRSGPLWTARSYDRCLLLALLYPVAMIYLFWGGSGHVGPAEAALGLSATSTLLWRFVFLICLALTGFAWFRAARGASELGWRKSGARHLRAFLAACFAGAFAVLVGGATVIAAAVGMAVVMTITGAIAQAWAGTLASFAAAIVGGGAITLAGGLAGLVAISFGLASSEVFAVVAAIAIAIASFVGNTRSEGFRNRLARMQRGLGWAALLGTTILLTVVMIAPAWIAQVSTWRVGGPLSLYLALLTLVNGPFNWVTLGLTRALLGAGLERRGWSPLGFGIIDLAVATLVTVLLAIVALLAVQMYGHLTELGGSTPVLDIRALLQALDDPAQRGDRQYWWLYVMLFATLIPSVANVSLGALSLIRGHPGLNRWLAGRMPSQNSVLPVDRIWIVPILSLQFIMSLFAGVAVMVGTLWLFLAFIFFSAGGSLVAYLQFVAAQDLPATLLHLVGLL